MPTKRTSELTEEEWLRRMSELRSEVSLPGYWKTLAENAIRWSEELSVGPYWNEAKARLDQWRSEYRSLTDADLLSLPGLPSFVPKPESSIRDKVFRRCKQDDSYMARAFPPEGLPLPRIGDLVRTRIACRYIDGVEFLANKLVALAAELNLSADRRREGRIEGYFAQHVTISQEVIYRLAGTSNLGTIRCEVQIASEMATRMWNAAHPLYESVRGNPDDPEDWQWKPDDPRFISHQLGHMIHLADGLLVQLRQATAPKRSGT